MRDKYEKRTSKFISKLVKADIIEPVSGYGK